MKFITVSIVHIINSRGVIRGGSVVVRPTVGPGSLLFAFLDVSPARCVRVGVLVLVS